MHEVLIIYEDCDVLCLQAFIWSVCVSQVCNKSLQTSILWEILSCKCITAGGGIRISRHFDSLLFGFEEAFPVFRAAVAEILIHIDGHVPVTDLPQRTQAEMSDGRVDDSKAERSSVEAEQNTLNFTCKTLNKPIHFKSLDLGNSEENLGKSDCRWVFFYVVW